MISRFSGCMYLDQTRASLSRSMECGHIEKAVYIGLESVADIPPWTFVSGTAAQLQVHACWVCHCAAVLRHRSMHAISSCIVYIASVGR